MQRRSFITTTLLAGGALALRAPHVKASQAKARKYHLRYAPHLTILGRELTIPQRLDLIGEGFVEALDDRDHEDDSHDTDTYTKDRQSRAQLVRPQRVERH